MKRILALLLMAVLLLTAAAAEELALSPALEAKMRAMEAIREKYGFTNEVLGMFTLYVTQEEASFCVKAMPNNYLPVDRIGEYTVTLTAKAAQVAWTLDDQDPALWQSDALDSPCWGVRQLDQIRLSYGVGLDKYLPEDYQPSPMPPEYGTLTFRLQAPQDSDLPLAQAEALADAAIALVYSMPQADVRALDHTLDPDLLLASDGTRLWRITYADMERCFSVLINTATGEVFDIVLTTGGNG